LHSSRLAVDVFRKLVHGPCFLRHCPVRAPQAAHARQGRWDDPQQHLPRHRLSSFLLATRVKENFKFWLRWQSDRSWSQGKGTPPFHSSGFSFNFVDSGCGVLWRVLFFRDLPRAMGRPGAISCIVPGPAFRLHCTCQAESLCSPLSKYLTFSEARAISARSQLLLFSKLITKLLSSTIYTTRPKKWSIGSS
jgi:hypothetical protein